MTIDSNTTNTIHGVGPKCPECKRRRGMVTWTGPEPPKCPACAGASVIDDAPLQDIEWELDDDEPPDFDPGRVIDAKQSDIARLESKLDRIIELLEDSD